MLNTHTSRYLESFFKVGVVLKRKYTVENRKKFQIKVSTIDITICYSIIKSSANYYFYSKLFCYKTNAQNLKKKSRIRLKLKHLCTCYYIYIT